MKIKSQCGFATIEILLAVAIIAIFSSIAIPNMARLLDKVYLDYEMKRLYSDLNFARAISKSAKVSEGIPFGVDTSGGVEISIQIYGEGYSATSMKNSYSISRNSVSPYSYYRHKIKNDIILSFTPKGSSLDIEFTDLGKSKLSSNTITLTSKFGETANVIIDSLGRVRYEK